MAEILLLVHVAATLFMVGLIWFVQVVHYPLFGRVGGACFGNYHAAHVRQTTLVVAPPMIIEGATAVLLFWLRPDAIAVSLVWLGLGLLVGIWLATRWLQIPQHRVLSGGLNRLAYRNLVMGNWLRTVAWSLRGVLVLWMVSAPGT